MGYESQFNLAVYDFCLFQEQGEMAALSERFDSVVEALRSFSEDAQFALDESGDSSGWAKWDNVEDEVEAFSRCYPELLFVVTVCGQDDGDYWRLFAHNGRYTTTCGWIEYGQPNLDDLRSISLHDETTVLK